MRHESPPPGTHSGDVWTCTETIDEAASAIRVRGRVDRLGADLLRGTIEQLGRRGHRHITVTVRSADDVDACARAVLAEVADDLARSDGRLPIRCAVGAGVAGLDRIDHPGDHRRNGHAGHRDGVGIRPRPAVR